MNANDGPGWSTPLSPTPVSRVAICADKPSFLQRTVLPEGIRRLGGVNPESLISTRRVVGGPSGVGARPGAGGGGI